jgi:hypothetical protein
MLGFNSLAKLFRKTIGPRLEAFGLLPHRYYLSRVLDALAQDDIDEAVRMVTLAATGKENTARWRLVCQQVIFRCRVLTSVHEKQMERIKTEAEILGKTADIRERYLQLQHKEAKARDILRKYERSLLRLLENENRTNSQPLT